MGFSFVKVSFSGVGLYNCVTMQCSTDLEWGTQDPTVLAIDREFFVMNSPWQ